MPHVQVAKRIDNLNYYQGTLGHSIMDSANFSPEIELYLSTELAVCATLTSQYGYQYLVEFGCGMLRLAGVSMVGETWYFGVDVREAIRYRNRSFIQSHNLSRCRFIRGKANRIARLANCLLLKPGSLSETYKGLIVLPFNFTGNVSNLPEFINTLSLTGQDILISQFSTNPRTMTIRREYYSSCGLNLKVEHGPMGCAFRDGTNFSSYSYHAEYMDALMATYGYQRAVNFTNHIHHIAHYRNVVATAAQAMKLNAE